MRAMAALDFSANVERFTGFGAHYDQVRPSPPRALADLLLPLAGYRSGRKPALVVDLGSGTGLATRYWAGRAGRVIGVEPSADMRDRARTVGGDGVEYREGFSHATGLPDGAADLVVCSQALHWMEPETTFREVARVLRPGGVFAACDYDWPPSTGFWEADQAYLDCMALGHRLERERRVADRVLRWDKEGHLARMRASGRFRFVRECLLHHEDEGDAARLVGLMLSQGHARSLLKSGLSAEDLQLDRLAEAARRAMGDARHPWLWSARVRLAVR